MEENVTLPLAFGAGILSFISPCVLPLIPGYLSYISGLSLDEMRGVTAAPAAGTAVAVGAPPDVRRRILLSSLAFILGFTLVFVAIGATASAVGQFVNDKLPLLGRLAGAVIIIFGLHTMGVLRIEWLYQDTRVQTKRRPAGFVGAMLVGIAFAFGWTLCIGPILSGILFLAGSQDSVGEGVGLLFVYSMGLGVPFFATALAINRFFAALARIRSEERRVGKEWRSRGWQDS